MLKILLLCLFACSFSVATVAAAPQLYTIASYSTQNLGTVTVSGASCSASTSIGSAGSYSVSVGCTVTSITIDGQTVTSPNSGPITLANGHQVRINWESSDLVEIFDIYQVNSPIRQ